MGLRGTEGVMNMRMKELERALEKLANVEGQRHGKGTSDGA